MKLIELIRDWAEVWALLIPLVIIILHRPRGKEVRLLVWYVIIGFFFNLAAMFMLEYSYLIPKWMEIDGMVNNNIFYNLHSFTRVVLFSCYIITIRSYRFPLFLKTLFVVYLLFVLVNFTFWESPFYLSTRLFSAESIVLLIMCLSYFFRSIQDESQTNWLRHSSFLVCTGVSIYEAITFFIFLFFYPLHNKDSAFANSEFAIMTMRIYTAMFVLLCILLAMALYKSKRESHPINKEYK